MPSIMASHCLAVVGNAPASNGLSIAPAMQASDTPIEPVLQPRVWAA